MMKAFRPLKLAYHEWRICRIWSAPRLETIQRMIRVPIAEWMNRYQDTCWQDLVLWSVHPSLHPFYEILDMRGTAGFCERNGNRPYCGKCTHRAQEQE